MWDKCLKLRHKLHKSRHKPGTINLIRHHNIYQCIYKDSLLSQMCDDLLYSHKLNILPHLYKLYMSNGRVNMFNYLCLNHNILAYKDIKKQVLFWIYFHHKLNTELNLYMFYIYNYRIYTINYFHHHKIYQYTNISHLKHQKLSFLWHCKYCNKLSLCK